ncbi:MAG: hypothetical protein OEY01_05985 [Desulfobulbaceae bacterium]|nr:hypothetical protein [Desulfobulbaceae bacterium]HIJ78660.1 hypothetical protein [Deltaproteobacteria bacterium]
MPLRTCVHPSGRFVYGLHQPGYQVTNLREQDQLSELGTLDGNKPHGNARNFPQTDVEVEQADWIYEIPNPFPFRGTTFISKSWAAAKAGHPAKICIPAPPATSMHQSLKHLSADQSPAEIKKAFQALPEAVLVTLAATSTDPRDLILLAELSCQFSYDENGRPMGLQYQRANGGKIKPIITNEQIFETVVNNIHLPDNYKEIMVLRPGVQGDSEIVGDYCQDAGQSHIFEYLRRNSYIPWGHYAANMANDAIRYQTRDLTCNDIHGLRHLYYQRTFIRLAALLKLPLPAGRKQISVAELEQLRLEIAAAISNSDPQQLTFNATLWGWNFGFDYAASGYRLHASHQQIHQQFAMLPATVPAWHDGEQAAAEAIPAYGCGDLIADFCLDYKKETGKDFFPAYLAAIRNNRRMDNQQNLEADLIVYEDEQAMIVVPKAQTSQWELHIMPTKPVGNIIEADTATRASIDTALLIAQQILAEMGARLVTSIEYAKRLGQPDSGQHLIYALLPKLPYSMGAFSEAQLRWINGHFPEDFAAACRRHLPQVLRRIGIIFKQ